MRTQSLGSDQSSQKTGTESSPLSISTQLERVYPVCRGGSGEREEKDSESENSVCERIEFVNRRPSDLGQLYNRNASLPCCFELVGVR